MPERIGGNRRKMRGKLTKGLREKGKISLKKFFQEFKEGDRVTLLIEPAYQKGLYNKRFYGKMGKVLGKQGKCYTVEVLDGKTKKTAIVHPIHIKKVN